MFSPNFTVLPLAQQQIWPMLAGSKNCKFVLYGGTALSLRFGHRQSMDFDFFSYEKLNKETTKLFYYIPLLHESNIIQEDENTLTFLTKDNIKLSFFGNINFDCIVQPELTNDQILYVASTIDIMATKLKTLLQRIAVKDYIDIATIIKSGIKLEEGLSAAISIFKNKIPAYDVIRALTYFDLKQLNSLSENYKKILIDAVKNLNYDNIHEISVKKIELNQHEM